MRRGFEWKKSCQGLANDIELMRWIEANTNSGNDKLYFPPPSPDFMA